MATQTRELKKELQKTTADAQKAVKTTAATVQKELTETAGDVKDAAQKVFLAGLGALAVAEEEGSKLFKKLVKKGEKVELPGLGGERVQKIRQQIAGAADEAQGAVKTRVEDAAYMAGETADKMEDRMQDAVASVMKRVGVPTRAEISALTASVERLTSHIEALKAERSTPRPTGIAMDSVGGGWYEIRIGDVVVEKVQGKDVAEAAVVRLQATAA